MIPEREGDQVFALPTIQALMLQLARIAVKGNGAAMRMFIHMIQTIEQEQAVAAQTKEPEGAESRTITDEERARALAVFMAKVRIKGLLKD